jgi:hypothetical protein
MNITGPELRPEAVPAADECEERIIEVLPEPAHLELAPYGDEVFLLPCFVCI